MLLWKVDYNTWTVRQVEGEQTPGKDTEGDECYLNTHFADKGAAIAALLRNAKAMVAVASIAVDHRRSQLADAEQFMEQARLDLLAAQAEADEFALKSPVGVISVPTDPTSTMPRYDLERKNA